MADTIKISQMDPAGSLTGLEFMPIVQNGVNVRTNPDEVLTFVEDGIEISESQVTNLVTDLANKQPLDAVLTSISEITTNGVLNKTDATTVSTLDFASTNGSPAGGSDNLVSRDGGGNTALNNILLKIEFRNALGTPVTLNVNSAKIQEFDGGSTPTDILMPDATTILPEWSFEIHNFSSAVVSVKDNLGGAICTLPIGGIVTVVCLVTATAGGTWEFIVGTTQGLTTGSVLFSTTGGFTAQDNANFFWDDSLNQLNVKGCSVGSSTTVPTNGLYVEGSIKNNALTASQIVVTDASKNLASQSAAALTKVDDTNVTLTLGGTPATALFQATSITVGWSGQLGVTRGGTGLGSTTANQILYSSSNNVIAGLATGNNGVVITSGAGVPSVSSTLPSAVQGNITSTGTLGSLTVTGNINNTALTASQVVVSDGSKNLASVAYTAVGARVLIQTQIAANSTNIDFTTGLGSYDLLEFVYVGVRPIIAGNVLLQMLVSNNGGSSYITSNYKSGLQVFSFNSATPSNSNLTTAMQISGNYTTTAGEFGSGSVFIAKLSSLNFNAWGTASLVSSTAPFLEFFQGTNTSNSGCNAVRFNFSGGSAQIAQGTFSVYGYVQ
jgi:hypothetical protein